MDGWFIVMCTISILIVLTVVLYLFNVYLPPFEVSAQTLIHGAHNLPVTIFMGNQRIQGPSQAIALQDSKKIQGGLHLNKSNENIDTTFGATLKDKTLLFGPHYNNHIVRGQFGNTLDYPSEYMFSHSEINALFG